MPAHRPPATRKVRTPRGPDVRATPHSGPAVQRRSTDRHRAIVSLGGGQPRPWQPRCTREEPEPVVRTDLVASPRAGIRRRVHDRVSLDRRAPADSVLPALAAAAAPRIVTVCCEQTPRAHLDAVHARGAHVHTVSCAGNLHSSVIERMLRGGAAGVMVCACPPRDCESREGPKWLHERLYNDREAELQARVDRRRVRVATFAPGDRRGAIAAYEAFAHQLAALPRSEALMTDLVFECEPVAAEEADS